VSATHLAIGVERMDYTKGVLERFRAIERLLEKHARYLGRFTLVQGRRAEPHAHQALPRFPGRGRRPRPSASTGAFQDGDWKPIVFLKKHHSHREILPLYRAADVCMVTSLHDGMNLVAKEFVAARADEDGVLLLSRFAGAALELREALIVNPYDVEQMARRLRYALEMPPDERRSRMQRMRETVRENNIYRWAGTLIGALAQVPMESLQPSDRV
jgi:trehalose 6-phosphate synthase